MKFTQCSRFQNPLEIFKTAEIKRVHESSLKILEEIGIKILDKRSLNFLYEKGVEVDFEKKIVNFSNDIDSKILNSVKSNPEVIQIIDMYNHNNKKLIISKGEKKQFNHSDLQQFFGIHKDTCFEIDQKSKTLTNLGEIELNIGINGTFLKKSEQIPIDTKTIVFINKIGCLGIVI